MPRRSHPQADHMPGQRVVAVRRDLLPCGIRKIAGGAVADAEGTAIDLEPVHHADVFRTGPDRDARCDDPRLDRGLPRNGGIMAYGRCLGHPFGMGLGHPRQTRRRRQRFETRFATVEIHLGANRLVEDSLVEFAARLNDCLPTRDSRAVTGRCGRGEPED